MHGKQFVFGVYRQQRRRDVPPVNVIDQIFFIGISGGVQLRLPVADKLKGDVRMRQRKALHQISDIISLRLRGL